MADIVNKTEREVKVSAELAPRDFSTGSVGYGAYTAMTVDGIRHQLTLNVVVNGSKKWTDEAKLAWLDAHKDAVVATVTGYADVFKSENSGWRFNSQQMVGGHNCTVSGALVLSKKTVAAAAAKAEKTRAKMEREKAAIKAHADALRALKDSLKPKATPKSVES